MTDTGLQSLLDYLTTTIASIEEMDIEEEDTMKVTINSSGDVSFDVEDVKEAVALAAHLRNGKTPAKKKAKPEAMTLTPALHELYENLVGIGEETTAPALAETLGIKASAVSARLRALERYGLAERVSRGVWRAVS